MKKILALLIAFALVLPFGAGIAGAGEFEGEPVHWKVNTSINEYAARYLSQVLDEIVEESNGQFTYDLYCSSSLVQITEVPAALYNNVCQLALVPCSVVSSQVVYNAEVIGYPFLGITDNYKAWQMYMDMREAFPEMDEDLTMMGIKFWSGYMNPGYNLIWNTDREVRMPEDIAGLKIQTTNVVLSNLMAAMGAAPVNSGATDLYSNMEKSVVNGCHMNLATGQNFGIPQVTKSISLFGSEYDQGIQFELQLLAMSLEAWNELPDNLKEIFEAHVDEMAQLDCQRQSEACWTFMENVSEDTQVYELTEEEIAAWKEAAQPFIEANIDELVSKGYERIPEQYEFVLNWLAEHADE